MFEVLDLIFGPNHFTCCLASYFADVILCQVLYVVELRQDLEKGKATFTAVSEFLLTHPVLSFGVRDVAHSRLRHTEVLPAEEESESLTTGAHVHSYMYTHTHKKANSFHFCSLLIIPVTLTLTTNQYMAYS